jgi:hypothetical protein
MCGWRANVRDAFYIPTEDFVAKVLDTQQGQLMVLEQRQDEFGAPIGDPVEVHC